MRTPLRVLNSAVRNRLHMKVRPEVVTHLVTLRCNLKCTMCDVWKIKDYPEMDLEQIDKVYSDLGRLSVVRLSGGEPFLRKDMAEIINIVRERSNPKYIQINTNMVEILVALVILTVGILALGLLSGQFNRQTNISDLTIERSASLQSAIEEIRSTPFEDVAAGSVTIDPPRKDIGTFL